MTINEIYESVKEYIWQLERNKEKYLINPEKDFTRHRKISFSDCVMSLLCMSGGTLFSEVLEYFSDKTDLPSVSAYLQQRAKIKYSAFEQLFRSTVNLSDENHLYHGYRLFAADGSDIQIPSNPMDEDTYYPGSNGQKPYNLIHLNAIYDIITNTYQDVFIQGSRHCAEHEALNHMVDRSCVEKALVIADRGYESYNVMAHINDKGWKYLIRVKDISGNGIVSRLDLPSDDEFDIDIDLNMTRKTSNKMKRLFEDRNHYRYAPQNSKFDFLPSSSGYKEDAVFYQLPFRVVRFQITDNQYETIVTNLDKYEFTPVELKKLYAMRWGIETSFRTLKYNIGVIYFHSWKKELVMQEVFARLALFNITASIACCEPLKHISKKNYSYRVNVARVILICRKLFLDRISPHYAQRLISTSVVPIRNERSFKRRTKPGIAVNFIYRIA